MAQAVRARGPVDPRLLRYAASARSFFLLGGLVGVLQTASIVALAWGVSAAIVGPDRVLPLVVLGLAVLARAACAWLLDLLAARGAARVKSELRMRLVAAVSALGPRWLAGRNTASVTTVAGAGLDALDGYFARFLPQLLLTATAVPIILVVLFTQDLETGIIVLVSLPVIPLFMVLVGWATQAVQRQQWAALTTLATGFLEVVEGLSTLTIFGRQHRQEARIAEVTERYRERTMAVLRISFVSGFVLELAASLSVAVVAVSIGVRLVEGSLPLAIGLFVLVLLPDLYLPIRAVGAQFHASADGVAAAQDVFAILDEAQASVTGPASLAEPVEGPALRQAQRPAVTLTVDDLSIAYGDTPVVEGFGADFRPGAITALIAPSGAGKSSIVAALLGFVPHGGTISYGSWRPQSGQLRDLIAWSGQRPSLAAGTVASNIALGDADDTLLAEAMRLACVDVGFPALGVGGAGLSGGQAQRVAIARAIYRALQLGCPIIVLDEPTSALDAETEASVLMGLRELADRGHIVIVVSHRSAVVSFADSVVSPGVLV